MGRRATPGVTIPKDMGEAYWKSILITSSEYAATLKVEAHRHALKVTKGYAGTYFYECGCGWKSGELPFAETRGRKV